MPPKEKTCNKGVRVHGTEKNQQTILEPYKQKAAYKKLKLLKDNTNNKLRDILENNCWNLKDLFEKELPEFLNDICNDGAVAWNNGIQYLDYANFKNVKINVVSLKKFKEGEYKTLFRDKRTRGNNLETEQAYAGRIEFFTKTFNDFKKFSKNDDLKWIVKHNRLLLYNILKYHHEEGNVIYTINRDLKVMTRVMKLLLGEDDELRYKYSVLQTAFTDVENLKDDLNKISTDREFKTFVPYEQLFDICEKLERDYFAMVNLKRRKQNKDEYINLEEMYERNEEDGKTHNPQMFHKHQLLLALALNIWNFPSRTENFTMFFIEDVKDVKPGENYVHITDDDKCQMIYNDDIKCHKPISYILNSAALSGLNNRLCRLLKYSYNTYKRKSLFLQKNEWGSNQKGVSSAAVRKWISLLVPNKNIGVNTFRSSFVSYYFPKWNNRQRNVMAIRMRTSMSQIMRSYLKFYTDPDVLAQVKIEPDDELVHRVARGRSQNDRYDVDDEEVVQQNNEEIRNIGMNEANDVDRVNEMNENEIDYRKRRQDSFKKWYQNEANREKHKNRTKAAYGARYIRELNKGIIDFSKMTKETKDKYNIKRREGTNGVEYYIEE